MIAMKARHYTVSHKKNYTKITLSNIALFTSLACQRVMRDYNVMIFCKIYIITLRTRNCWLNKHLVLFHHCCGRPAVQPSGLQIWDKMQEHVYRCRIREVDIREVDHTKERLIEEWNNFD